MGNNVFGFAQFKYYLFGKATTEVINGCPNIISTCTAETNATDEWKALTTTKNSGSQKTFSKATPKLDKTPSAKIVRFTKRIEVSRSFDSEERMMYWAQKMRCSYALCDSIYRDRLKAFHWNLDLIIKTLSLNVSFSASNDNALRKIE